MFIMMYIKNKINDKYKLVFISNFFNHHQVDLCDSLYKIYKDSFCFIQLEYLPREKFVMGYPKLDRKYLRYVKNINIQEVLLNSENVILGNVPNKYFFARIRSNLNTFIYTEKLVKSRLNIFQLVYFIFINFIKFTLNKNRKLFVLAAGSYVINDLKFFFPKEKIFNWGYFLKKPRRIPPLKLNKPPVFLWVGRLIDWKNPTLAIEISNYMKLNKIPFKMKIIGDGPLLNELESKIKFYQLQDSVQLLGYKKNFQVKSIMRKSNFFLFTSNWREGWGVVLNEAIQSGLVPIVNSYIGSCNFLVNKETGFIYSTLTSLYLSINKLPDLNSKKFSSMRNDSFSLLNKLWNAEVASNRLAKFINSLSSKTHFDKYPNGPLS